MKPEYDSTSEAFDYIAADYDSIYSPESNLAMAWMRKESLALLRKTFPRGSRLLELGCGTGEEAIFLAKTGCEIVATDISPKMASITLQKVMDQKLDHRIQIAVLPAGMLDKLQPPQSFDGAYASFGVLNCEPNLHAVGKALAHLIRPGGLFLTSVMGQTSLFEIAWYLLNLQPGRAFRRLQKGWHLAPVAGDDGRKVVVPTRYLKSSQIIEAFPGFALKHIMALPLFLPPPYAASLWKKHPRFFRLMERAEFRFHKKWPWYFLGDHTVFVLRRQPNQVYYNNLADDSKHT